MSLKTLVVLPVYNEQKTLEDILKRLDKVADVLVCVNDGSTDQSASILEAFARKYKNTYIVHQPKNSGMAGALKAGFLFVLHLAGRKLVKGEDIVVTIDADGQHKPEYIPKLASYMKQKDVDVVLTRRDFSVYPTYKIWGNRFLTWTNSILSGVSYKDVESGLRLLKVKTLEPILRHYKGVKYSCAQEIALLSAKVGYRIDNEFLVEIAYYRPGTTVWDGFIVLGLSFYTYFRWVFGVMQQDVDWNSALMKKSYESSRKLWKR